MSEPDTKRKQVIHNRLIEIDEIIKSGNTTGSELREKIDLVSELNGADFEPLTKQEIHQKITWEDARYPPQSQLFIKEEDQS